MRREITVATRLAIVCNPNNPTSTALPFEDIAAFVADVPRHVCVIVDEAYCEFNVLQDPDESIDLLDRHANLVLLRTFSKVYGLCGLRVGYALCGSEEFRTAVDQVRQPFFCNAAAQAAALEALNHQDEVTRRVERNLAERIGLEDLRSSASTRRSRRPLRLVRHSRTFEGRRYRGSRARVIVRAGGSPAATAAARGGGTSGERALLAPSASCSRARRRRAPRPDVGTSGGSVHERPAPRSAGADEVRRGGSAQARGAVEEEARGRRPVARLRRGPRPAKPLLGETAVAEVALSGAAAGRQHEFADGVDALLEGASRMGSRAVRHATSGAGERARGERGRDGRGDRLTTASRRFSRAPAPAPDGEGGSPTWPPTCAARVRAGSSPSCTTGRTGAGRGRARDTRSTAARGAAPWAAPVDAILGAHTLVAGTATSAGRRRARPLHAASGWSSIFRAAARPACAVARRAAVGRTPDAGGSRARRRAGERGRRERETWLREPAPRDTGPASWQARGRATAATPRLHARLDATRSRSTAPTRRCGRAVSSRPSSPLDARTTAGVVELAGRARGVLTGSTPSRNRPTRGRRRVWKVRMPVAVARRRDSERWRAAVEPPAGRRGVGRTDGEARAWVCARPCRLA